MGTTTNFGWTYPIDGGSADTWGAILNALVIAADASLQTVAAARLLKSSNLSDLANAGTARSNLGLGGAATLNVGTTAGTLAAGDDLRLAGAALKANNLSDLGSASTARTNLGLGGLAVLSSVSNASWSGAALSIANGGTGATDATGARSALGLGALAALGTINDGNWSGTALGVAHGGTGATDAASARGNLGLGVLATQNAITKAQVDAGLGLTAARVASGSSSNSGKISWGTGAAPTLDEGEIYLRHA